MSPAFRRTAVLSVLAAFLSACGGCGRTPVRPDGGVDTEVDAGGDLPDAGGPEDAGTADAGSPDAGLPELQLLRVLPPRGGAAGGTQVVLQGSGFVEGVAATATGAKKVTQVTFGANPVLDFQVIDDSTIDLRVPPGAVGKVNVTLTNPRGTASCTQCFTYYEELFLTGLAPGEGPLSGGTEVKLSGQGLMPDVQVLFGTLTSPRVTWVSTSEVRAVAPPGLAAGTVDVTAYDKNGMGLLRNAFRYRAPPRVSSVQPPVGALAGGTSVVLLGEGLSGVTAVRFGAQAAASFTVDSDGQLTAVTPPAAQAGAVDVVLEGPHGTWTVRGGFTYADASGAFAAFALSPRLGPSAGGTRVVLTGQGLDVGPLSVTVGGVPVTVGARTATTAELFMPPRSGTPRVSDVVVTDGASTRTLQGGWTWRLELQSVTPPSGPVAGGTAVTVGGVALPPDVVVQVGALEATLAGAVTESAVPVTTPPGSGGAPLPVRARSAADAENEAVLPAAFTYEEPLSVGRAQPDHGAIAGGTLVTVLGTGFGPGTLVDFGADRAKDVKVVDAHTLTCRTPRAATVGSVDVKVTRAGVSDVLAGGFAFVDPRSISGGQSGGPLVGTLNVTVLDATRGFEGSPVPLARVMLGTDPGTPFQGFTDARGQLVFSDPSLVKAQSVTVFKDGYSSVTVASVNAENLTVFVERTGGGEPSSGPPPAGTPPSLVRGRVTGFKAPRALQPGERLEARVFVSYPSPLYGAPFSQEYDRTGETWVVTQDGGTFEVFTTAGLRAAYAYFGIANNQLGTFEPYLLGIRRNVTASPDTPAENQDIILDMQLNVVVPVTLDQPVVYPNAVAGTHGIYAWLDLGAEGFVANPYNTANGGGRSGPGGTGTGQDTTLVTTGAPVSFGGFPALDGSNFLFVVHALEPSLALSGLPFSYAFRRQPGNLSLGVTLGPLLPVPNFTAPNYPSLPFDGTISWTREPGVLPDVQEVRLVKLTMMGLQTLWQVVLPGTETQVTLPQPAVDALRASEPTTVLYVLHYGSRSPKFSYAQWTYEALSLLTWSSYTVALSNGFFP
jgi:hypothetical protein